MCVFSLENQQKTSNNLSIINVSDHQTNLSLLISNCSHQGLTFSSQFWKHPCGKKRQLELIIHCSIWNSHPYNPHFTCYDSDKHSLWGGLEKCRRITMRCWKLQPAIWINVKMDLNAFPFFGWRLDLWLWDWHITDCQETGWTCPTVTGNRTLLILACVCVNTVAPGTQSNVLQTLGFSFSAGSQWRRRNRLSLRHSLWVMWACQ